ncbi:hypothetical protein [Vibrio mediterranei]|uniref:hypothetical protein n=1 Tax=Vibrio mediterranei TaxID=689 RepID=UPI00148B64D0|nr:hypothetical protein [Vibrio mediterranei]NOH31774.1 hypothetical protein [Vibrio mediterranei]
MDYSIDFYKHLVRVYGQAHHRFAWQFEDVETNEHYYVNMVAYILHNISHSDAAINCEAHLFKEKVVAALEEARNQGRITLKDQEAPAAYGILKAESRYARMVLDNQNEHQ